MGMIYPSLNGAPVLCKKLFQRIERSQPNAKNQSKFSFEINYIIVYGIYL
jgi:hypothetical protein